MKLKGRIVLYIAVIVLSALLVSTVSAQELAPEAVYVTFVSAPGTDLTPIDNLYDGSLGTMACDTIDTSGTIAPGTPVRNVRLATKVDHTWVGDLVYKLETPAGTILGLMHRPGVVNGSDGDDVGAGDSSDLDGRAIRWRDFGATMGEDMGSTIGGTEFVCTTDLLCDYAPSPEVIVGAAGIPDLRGEDASGTWTFCVGDGAGGDNGTFRAWKLWVGIP